MDLNAACASFVFAMITGAQFVATGCSQLALIIGADCMSRVVNPLDKKTYPLFGDAAGAVLLSAGSQEQGIESYAVGTEGSGAGLLNCPMGGSRMPFSAEGAKRGLQFMHMDGRPVFKWAIRVLTETISDVLAAAEVIFVNKREAYRLTGIEEQRGDADERAAQGGQGDDGGNPGEVLENHPSRHEGHLGLAEVGMVVGGERADIRFGHGLTVDIAECRLEEHLDRVREPFEIGIDRIETVDASLAERRDHRVAGWVGHASPHWEN